MESYYERNKECRRAYQKAYRAAHREQTRDYDAYYFQNVTKWVRTTKPRAPPKEKAQKPKTTIRYNSGTVTEKKIRTKKHFDPPPPPPAPGPAVVAWDGVFLDWNKL